jgi:hypothetical protein
MFDPIQRIAEIGLLQSIHHLLLAILVLLLTPGTVSMHRALAMDDLWVWAPLFTSIPMAYAIALVVKKPKKCLDYAATITILHCVVVTALDSFPTHVTWWIAQGIAMVCNAVIAEMICVKKEQEMYK